MGSHWGQGRMFRIKTSVGRRMPVGPDQPSGWNRLASLLRCINLASSDRRRGHVKQNWVAARDRNPIGNRVAPQNGLARSWGGHTWYIVARDHADQAGPGRKCRKIACRTNVAGVDQPHIGNADLACLLDAHFNRQMAAKLTQP